MQRSEDVNAFRTECETDSKSLRRNDSCNILYLPSFKMHRTSKDLHVYVLFTPHFIHRTTEKEKERKRGKSVSSDR